METSSSLEGSSSLRVPIFICIRTNVIVSCGMSMWRFPVGICLPVMNRRESIDVNVNN